MVTRPFLIRYIIRTLLRARRCWSESHCSFCSMHDCHTRCPSVIRTGETCSVALNRFDFIDVAFECKLIARSTIHYRPWRNFLSPEFTKKLPEGSTLILYIHEFP